MTFDYVQAWDEVARPAFEALPANIRRLLDRVTAECKELHQLPDTSMPWPENDQLLYNEQLRHAFDGIESEWLAVASRVVYFVGHWRHAKSGDVLPREAATWKFSHYADQVLRGRLGLPERGDNGRDKSMIQYSVHEGLIRIGYSSRDAWTFREVAPATAEGYAEAQKFAAALRSVLDLSAPPSRATSEQRDTAAYQFFESFQSTLGTFTYWAPWADTDRFQCSEDEFKRRQAARIPPPDRQAMIEKLREGLKASIAAYTKHRTIEADGMIWLIERGLPTDNAIFYTHSERWCFGWRNPLTPEDRSALLNHLSEFPYEYDLKGGQIEECTHCKTRRIVSSNTKGQCGRCDWVTQ